MSDNGTLYWLIGDHPAQRAAASSLRHGVGSTALAANGTTGALISEQRYKPWGEQRYPAGASPLPTRHRFTGQIDDSEIGLYFYGARYYSSVLGRFLNADTLVPNPSDPQQLNRYAYVNNNPMRYIDPSGHFTDDAMMAYLKQQWGDKLWKKKWNEWLVDQKWMDMMPAAHGNDVLAMVNSKGNKYFYKFEGNEEDLLTGATQVNDLIGTKLAGVSIFLEDLRHRQLGNNVPGEMIEAGLWRVSNGHLSMEYHDDPRIWAKSSVMTRAERDAWVATYAGLEAILNFMIPAGRLFKALSVVVSGGEAVATGNYLEDNGYKPGIDEWYIERTAIDHYRGWYDGSDGSLHQYP